MEFKSTVQWEQKSKLCKVYLNKHKDGSPYFFGELTKTQKILIKKVPVNQCNENESLYQIYLVPVTYEKQSVRSEPSPATASSDDVPF